MSRRTRYPKARNDATNGGRLTLCVAGYFDPAKHVDGREEKIVRVTAVVYDTVAERQVERMEFDGAYSLDAASDEVVALAVKHDVVIRSITEPVPLEKCPCGCDGWLDRIITAADLAAWPN